MSLSGPRRLDAIAAGMAALVEHVDTLSADLAALVADERARSAAALGIQAEEEAAKILILLDLVRMGWRDQKACVNQIDRFYDHLARGIYAQVVHFRPATVKELQRLIDFERRSRYLDGPNDVDWIFRNEVLTRRESSLYVDYVHTEDGDEWVSPASRDEYKSAWRVDAARLALLLAKAGATSRDGLEIVARDWRGVSLDPDTHWQVAAAINAGVLRAVHAAGLSDPGMTETEAAWLCDRWTFPLGRFDMDQVEVSDAELEEQRDRWWRQQL